MIALPQQMRDAFVAHARFCAPNEACGLVAVDSQGALRMAYCCTNVEHSPRRFTVDPREHYAAMRHAEQRGWSIGGSFHSHPAGPARPSASDVAGALDPAWVYFIAGPLPDPEVRAFRIATGCVSEVAIEVTPDVTPVVVR